MSENMNADKLIELKKLLDAGVVSQEEFDTKKAEYFSSETISTESTDTVEGAQASVSTNTGSGSTKEKQKQKASAKDTCLGCLGLIVIIFIAIALIGSCSKKDTDEKKETSSKVEQTAESREESEQSQNDKENADMERMRQLDDRAWNTYIEVLKKSNSLANLLQTNNMQTEEDIDKYKTLVAEYSDFFKSKRSEISKLRDSAKQQYEKDYLYELDQLISYPERMSSTVVEALETRSVDLMNSASDMSAGISEQTLKFFTKRLSALNKAGYSNDEVRKIMNDADKQIKDINSSLIIQ